MSDKEPKPNKKPINDANPIHPPRVQIASHAVEEHTHTCITTYTVMMMLMMMMMM